MSARDAPALEALADDAWLVRLGRHDGHEDTPHAPDLRTNLRVHAFCARLRAGPGWVRDVVPAYDSLALFFDSAQVTADLAAKWLLQQALSVIGEEAAIGAPSRLVEIPVEYGGDAGPDLDASAAELGLSPEELVRRHAGGEYIVAMIGFAPGFPYLLGLDPALALPRLATPRPRVPAGSVGIGGAQTGVYPRESPGGWRLLGRTPLTLFDAARESPSLLAPGDRVRFIPLPTPAHP